MRKLLEFRNILIKTVTMLIGVVCMIASVYNSVLWALLLTEKAPGKEVYWWLLIVGFFLALGAAFYNRIADAIAKGFAKIVDKFTTK